MGYRHRGTPKSSGYGYLDMEVSWNRGTPKSSHFHGIFHELNHLFYLGYHHDYGNPYMSGKWGSEMSCQQYDHFVGKKLRGWAFLMDLASFVHPKWGRPNMAILDPPKLLGFDVPKVSGWWFQTWLDYFPFHIWDGIILPIDSYFSRWFFNHQPDHLSTIIYL